MGRRGRGPAGDARASSSTSTSTIAVNVEPTPGRRRVRRCGAGRPAQRVTRRPRRARRRRRIDGGRAANGEARRGAALHRAGFDVDRPERRTRRPAHGEFDVDLNYRGQRRLDRGASRGSRRRRAVARVELHPAESPGGPVRRRSARRRPPPSTDGSASSAVRRPSHPPPPTASCQHDRPTMRIIAGTYGGRRLQAPPGDATRPTSDRVREALFSILGDRVDGARVLDLFAGSGALGLEALCRGAAAATFVDSAPRRHPRAAGQPRRAPRRRRSGPRGRPAMAPRRSPRRAPIRSGLPRSALQARGSAGSAALGGPRPPYWRRARWWSPRPTAALRSS